MTPLCPGVSADVFAQPVIREGEEQHPEEEEGSSASPGHPQPGQKWGSPGPHLVWQVQSSPKHSSMRDPFTGGVCAKKPPRTHSGIFGVSRARSCAPCSPRFPAGGPGRLRGDRAAAAGEGAVPAEDPRLGAAGEAETGGTGCSVLGRCHRVPGEQRGHWGQHSSLPVFSLPAGGAG